jgi:hypothetical protein
MSEADFEAAAAMVKTFTTRPSNDEVDSLHVIRHGRALNCLVARLLGAAVALAVFVRVQM